MDYFILCLRKMPNNAEAWDFTMRKFEGYYKKAQSTDECNVIVEMIDILEYKLARSKYEKNRRPRKDTNQTM